MMKANPKNLAPLSKKLEKTLDELARVTASLPTDDDMINYLIEAGEIGDPAAIRRGPKDA